MLTIADNCGRMLTYADVCVQVEGDDAEENLQGLAGAPLIGQLFEMIVGKVNQHSSNDVCWRMLTCADVC